ncbi:MAG TPA: efflux RND transporter periplasmic adaptor subunit [Gammaproteobacteria bacterium]|nr:efflux RND transporter periplasmic adaptor subunit [Gammaproteobacteria bacterium]
MKTSNNIAIGSVIALVLWIASGYVISGSSATSATAAQQERESLMKVRVKTFTTASVTSLVFVQGQLEPWRSVTLRAETSGTVDEINVDRGTRVVQGEMLTHISMDDREVRLARAEAQVAQSKADLEAAESLFKKKMQSENSVRAARANVAVTKAELAAIKLDIERTSVRAPFDGVVEDRPVELGVLLERGDSVISVVDDTRLKATAQVPQQSVGNLNTGQRVNVTLITGEQVDGTLTFISRLADEGTRSYRIEVEVPNTKLELVSGLSAVLEIPTGESDGHFLSPSLLILHDDGRLGVMAVDESNQANFYHVSLIRSEDGGVWVSGLPAQIRLITFGQGFIQAGEQVIPVNEAEADS